MTYDSVLDDLIERIAAARSRKVPLRIVGGDTKRFYGEEIEEQILDMKAVTGISSYEPSELVITARAGTPLVELEAVLGDRGQWLPFEPPRFAPGGTVGGMVAAGLSGPSRVSAGAVRDHVLGACMLNGRGELLRFGGQVIKNVAGYDVSRLLAGSLGVLGVICEVSLKVLPLPPMCASLRFEVGEAQALERLAVLASTPLPLSASAWSDGKLALRMSGAAAAVRAAVDRLGGEMISDEAAGCYWEGLRDQTAPFFADAGRAVQSGAALWRLAMPPSAPPLGLPGECLIEWGGAQRWLCTNAAAAAVRSAAAALGGYATLYRAIDKSPGVFHSLTPALARIHRDLKHAFDPDGLLNPGRLYPNL